MSSGPYFPMAEPEPDDDYLEAPPPTGYVAPPPPIVSPKAGDNYEKPQPAFQSSLLQPPPYGDVFYGQSPQPHQDGFGGADYGGELGGEPDVKGFDFSDKSIRRGFIRKVYSILMCQLGISVAFIAWFMYHPETRMHVQNNILLLIVPVIVVFGALICLACSEELRRQPPMNFIFLAVITVGLSFIAAFGASRYGRDEVLMAAGITAAVCLALTLFAFQTKYDFTMCGGILFVSAVILLIFMIVAIFVRNKIVQMVYSSLGALLFSIYLVYDTQMMMGGEHKYSVSPEEYVFAALTLYLDILNIFMYILRILGSRK